MLLEVADASMMQAEAETQPDDSTMPVDSVTVTDGVPVGHISKKIAVKAGEPNRIDDHENTAIEGRAKSSAVDDPIGRAEARQQFWSEAQGSRTVRNHNNDVIVRDCAAER